ncbi:aminoglycoside phosphotransferase family protein [Nocardia uniformis]|uniref:Aminoglycoside phosphotransferase family protein n=1 Tax=Nocardia uniformis TaxID=53432 RepID=A0A849CBM9_9NOCA|nr:aminoglycoside phosphotransferase family protein [Nocardia uniformis]NNH73685.1 aminoglycoside phosphotransferase family protein [Nocardia uniformis]
MTTSMTATVGGVDVAWAREILDGACAQVGLDPQGAKLIKFTNNAVYNLRAPVTVRIAGSTVIQQRVSKVIEVTRWLARHDMPTVRLVEDLPQPLVLDDQHVITFWHTVTPPPHSAAPDGHDLGRILRRYHALPRPPFDLPKWDLLTGIRERIAEDEILTADEHLFLQDTHDELAEQLDAVDYQLPAGPIHGDGFVGNLIAGPAGAVICDFDSASDGPREWDLTPVAVGKLRFNYPADHHSDAVAEYGYDITRWPHFPALRRLREFQLVTSVLPVLRSNTSLLDQWRHRFTTFQNGDLSARWTTYK